MPRTALIRQSFRYELAPTREQAKLLGSFTGASRYWFNHGLSLVKERLDRRAEGDESVDIPWSYKSLCSVIAPLKDEICPREGPLDRLGDLPASSNPRQPPRRAPRGPRAVVGVDLGLSALATLSTAEKIANPRPLAQALRKLRLAQRSLDRQRRANNPANYLPDGRVRPGTKRWRRSQRQLRTEARIRRLHERVANLRREQAHQLTTRLTREHGIIGVESLNVAGMLRNRRLARQISDVGWGLILTQLAYKASWAGSLLVSADAFYPSSKTCSGCGAVKAKLSLSERVFTCEPCGLVIDRDENAALNLAKLALVQARAEGINDPYLAPTEWERLNARGATDPARGSHEPRRRATATNREGSRKGSSRSRGGSESTRLREEPALA